jgi:hypothetical protein
MRVFKSYLLFWLPFLILLLFVSCRKETPECTGNCMEVKFAGRVFNRSTNTPLKNQMVTVAMRPNGYCLLCLTNYKIGMVKTGSDGRFDLRITIDSTWMTENHFTASVKVPDGYIMYPEPVGPGIGDDPEYSSLSFYDLDPARMGNMSFEFYPEVLLKINLHRTTTVSQDRSLGLSFTINDRTSVWGLVESLSNADTSLTINTAAFLYTTVVARKFIATGTVRTKTDSVYCRPGETNAIDIYY